MSQTGPEHVLLQIRKESVRQEWNVVCVRQFEIKMLDGPKSMLTISVTSGWGNNFLRLSIALSFKCFAQRTHATRRKHRLRALTAVNSSSDPKTNFDWSVSTNFKHVKKTFLSNRHYQNILHRTSKNFFKYSALSEIRIFLNRTTIKSIINILHYKK